MIAVFRTRFLHHCKSYHLLCLAFFNFFISSAAIGNTQVNASIRQIDSLNAAAKKAYDISYGTARLLADEAKANAIESDYSRGRIESTCILSLIDVNTNKTRAAIDSLYALFPSIKNDRSARELVYLTLGQCWYFQDQYDSSKSYLQRVIMLQTPGNESIAYAYSCMMLARIYSKMGVGNGAIEYYNKARSFLSRQYDKEIAAWLDDALGEIYHTQRLYDNAIQCFSRSRSNFYALGNRNGIISSVLHLGNVYYMQMKDDSAIHCYTQALQTALTLGDSTSIAINYSNLSRIFLEHGDTKKSIEYANRALSAITPGSYPLIEAGTYQQLGDIYGELNQFGRAVEYVQKALQTARKAGNQVIVQDSYKSLSELYQAMKRPEVAYQYLLAAYHIKDSSQSARFSKQLAEMEIRYETEKKVAEIKILKQQKLIDNLTLRQQQKRLAKQELFLVLFAMMAIAIVVALYFYVQRRRLAEQMRQNEVIRQTTDAERLRIAKDIHDELGSGLSKIKLLADIALYDSNEKKSDFKQTVQTVSHTSSALIENMRDLVWAMNPDNSNLENLIARMREYSDEYFEDLPIEFTMDIPEDVPAIPISKELNRNVFMILKEALQNIVKHSSATVATLRIELRPKFKMEISDNGEGYNVNTKHEGNGLTNMKTRSKTIGGQLYIETAQQKGVKLIFELDNALPL